MVANFCGIVAGPLGQGIANAVGLAASEAHLAARFNKDGHKLVDHYTYAAVSRFLAVFTTLYSLKLTIVSDIGNAALKIPLCVYLSAHHICM